jgi:UDPglucose--hexose-1-phosphate uridylyltransferase
MELRKHYFLDKWVIIATERAKRPHEFKRETKTSNEGPCFFCPGNENMTPPEIGRIQHENSWKMRWFLNKFPAVKEEGNSLIQTHNDFFTFSDAYGVHEVIVETPKHNLQLWDLTTDELYTLFMIYKQRIHELQKKAPIEYITVFKNHGEDAGTSITHSHSQVVAQNNIPVIIRQKIEHSKNSCPYCKILNIEKNSYRRCFENNNFVAFTPYASRFGLEIWVMPKMHLRNLEEFEKYHLNDLAQIMKLILVKLKEINVSYNYYLQYAPTGQDMHFHIEVIPRVARWAGYEFATETIINAITPEESAKFYRGEVN